jgi:ribulose-5-phosphate 4-epimerase/fuculose-1-phosphate aldolase
MNAPEKISPTSDSSSAATMPPEVAKYYKNLPQPPQFDNVADERLHRKQRLAAAFRIFAQWGLGEGAAGHITVRDPEFPNTFWLNPFGIHFSQVKVSNLIRVDHHGEVVEGDYQVNRAAFAIHSRVHEARPDAVAAAHTHGVYGRAFSALGKPLAMINQDVTAFYNDHAVYDEYGGVALEVDEGARIAKALGPMKAAILRNHGLITVGKSVEEAAWWYITMERNCQVQLMAEAASHGQPLRTVPEESCKQAYGVVGVPYAGWFQFNLLYEKLLAENNSFLN